MKARAQPPAAPHCPKGAERRRVAGIEHVIGRSQDGASCNGWHVPRPQAVSFAGSCGHLQSNQGRPMLECLFQPYAAPIPSHSLLGIVQQFATPTPPDNKGPGIPCALFNLKVKFCEPCTNRLREMYFIFPVNQIGKFAFFYFRILENGKKAAPCEGRLETCAIC